MIDHHVIRKLLLALAFSTAAHAQEFERVLIPVRATGLPGLFSSIWHTELTGFNEGEFPVPVGIRPEEVTPAPPHQFLTIPGGELVNFPQGFFVHVGREHGDGVHFQLQAFDVTRRASSFGAALPVPREREFTDQALSLLNVLVDPAFRTTLRVYGLENSPGAVRVRVTRMDRFPLSTFELQLELKSQHPSFGVTVPSFGIINDLRAALPPEFFGLGDADAPRAAIEITSLTSGQRVWAFATVTNNVTQHPSVIAPR